MNNKVYIATKVLSSMVNYGRELRIRADIRRKEKVEKVRKIVERMKKVQEEVEAVLRKIQEDMKRQVDRG